MCERYDCRPMAITGLRFNEKWIDLNRAIMDWDLPSMLKTYDDWLALCAIRITGTDAIVQRYSGADTARIALSYYEQYLPYARKRLGQFRAEWDWFLANSREPVKIGNTNFTRLSALEPLVNCREEPTA